MWDAEAVTAAIGEVVGAGPRAPRRDRELRRPDAGARVCRVGGRAAAADPQARPGRRRARRGRGGRARHHRRSQGRAQATRRSSTSVHAAGVRIVVYTLNRDTQWDAVTALGVDGIVTDDPGTLSQWQQARRTRRSAGGYGASLSRRSRIVGQSPRPEVRDVVCSSPCTSALRSARSRGRRRRGCWPSAASPSRRRARRRRATAPIAAAPPRPSRPRRPRSRRILRTPASPSRRRARTSTPPTMLASLNAANPPLNDPGVTMHSTQNVDALELLNSGIPTLRCSWGQPSEYGLATNVSVVDAARSQRRCSMTLRAAGFALPERVATAPSARSSRRTVDLDDNEVDAGRVALPPRHRLGVDGVGQLRPRRLHRRHRRHALGLISGGMPLDWAAGIPQSDVAARRSECPRPAAETSRPAFVTAPSRPREHATLAGSDRSSPERFRQTRSGGACRPRHPPLATRRPSDAGRPRPPVATTRHPSSRSSPARCARSRPRPSAASSARRTASSSR